jgi:glutamine synthetase adenylyltransferase
LFAQDPAFVEEIYGAAGLELVLPRRGAEEKIRDVLRRPERYVAAAMDIRRRLARDHSYRARLAELLKIVES